MTDDKIALRELLEKGSDASFLREMISFAAERLMALESDALCGAGHGERSEGRTNQRNGYRDRDWHTRAGTIELRIPNIGRISSTASSRTAPMIWLRRFPRNGAGWPAADPPGWFDPVGLPLAPVLLFCFRPGSNPNFATRASCPGEGEGHHSFRHLGREP